jgi:hypothetical protein
VRVRQAASTRIGNLPAAASGDNTTLPSSGNTLELVAIAPRARRLSRVSRRKKHRLYEIVAKLSDVAVAV